MSNIKNVKCQKCKYKIQDRRFVKLLNLSDKMFESTGSVTSATCRSVSVCPSDIQKRLCLGMKIYLERCSHIRLLIIFVSPCCQWNLQSLVYSCVQMLRQVLSSSLCLLAASICCLVSVTGLVQGPLCLYNATTGPTWDVPLKPDPDK